jgi:hypothetical protein
MFTAALHTLTFSAMTRVAEAPEQILVCLFGAKQVEILRDGATLIYRFGRPGRPEPVISSTAATGNLFYHRTLDQSGEDQTLRCENGAHSYVVFNAFPILEYRQEGAVDESVCS